MNNQSKNSLSLNNSTSDISPIEKILMRCDGVRKSGKGYSCRCPAHDDKNASLSITEADNGNCLIYCFAGCSALSIVQALGLELADLYPRRITENMTSHEKAERRLAAKQARWSAALDVLNFEANIVQIAAHETIKGNELDIENLIRLDLANKRIFDATAVLNAR